jgi:hypothetical protein
MASVILFAFKSEIFSTFSFSSNGLSIFFPAALISEALDKGVSDNAGSCPALRFLTASDRLDSGVLRLFLATSL